MTEEADTGFVRNYLDEELAEELELFTYTAIQNGEVKADDGTLELKHDHTIDGRVLDLEHAKKVLEYIHSVRR